MRLTTKQGAGMMLAIYRKVGVTGVQLVINGIQEKAILNLLIMKTHYLTMHITSMNQARSLIDTAHARNARIHAQRMCEFPDASGRLGENV